MAFWDRWPSWITELAGGAALSALAMVVTRDWRAAAIVSALFSITYERYFDRNGWSWTDVGQRAVGQIVGLVLTWWLLP